MNPDEAPSDAPNAHGGSAPEPPPGGDASASLSLWGRVEAAWANPAYRFVMLFLPYLALVSIGYPALLRYWGGFVQAFIDGTAWIEFAIFDLISSNIHLSGKMVTYGGFTVTIVDECTGLYEMLIYSAAVMAFPTSWRHKSLGILLGNPLIYFFNVVRIALLIAVGRFQHDWFDFMHVYFMQATMIVMITGVWLLWINYVVKDRDIARPDPGA